MNSCPMGDDGHPFSYEDPAGAYCEEHGLTVLWHPEPESMRNPPAEGPALLG